MWKKILALFTPIDYSQQPYGWLKNQFGHINITRKFLLLIVLFSLIYKDSALLYLSVPIPILWLLWEIRHYRLYNNLQDCIEDLFFENLSLLSFGIYVFSHSLKYLIFSIVFESIIFLIVFFSKYWSHLKK